MNLHKYEPAYISYTTKNVYTSFYPDDNSCWSGKGTVISMYRTQLTISFIINFLGNIEVDWQKYGKISYGLEYVNQEYTS